MHRKLMLDSPQYANNRSELYPKGSYSHQPTRPVFENVEVYRGQPQEHLKTQLQNVNLNKQGIQFKS